MNDATILTHVDQRWLQRPGERKRNNLVPRVGAKEKLLNFRVTMADTFDIAGALALLGSVGDQVPNICRNSQKT